ncbi:MAG TPA: DUF1622 domain-containing protein [Anaerolineae bacterium]|nr:DUF1622 domain-containing protein [Anaerolineae bacterium]
MNISDAVIPWIEFASRLIESLAIVIIVGAILYGLIRYLIDWFRSGERGEAYHGFKVRLGNGLLLGLEILVAADVIRTVALEPTLTNVIVLGLLVVIRTFLSWSLVVEIEGRWPWQGNEVVGEKM